MNNPDKYFNEKVVNLLKSIGYTHRIDNYYIIRESDGYINVNYDKVKNGPLVINFYKNYTTRRIHPTNVIDETFFTYESFVEFIEKYHKQTFRKLKIEKINGQKNNRRAI